MVFIALMMKEFFIGFVIGSSELFYAMESGRALDVLRGSNMAACGCPSFSSPRRSGINVTLARRLCALNGHGYF